MLGLGLFCHSANHQLANKTRKMSSLSKQIANLGKSSNKPRKGKVVSLLFSQADAAEVDAVTLLELARNSLAELQGFDHRFSEFATTLFDTSSTTIDRTVLNPEENNSLDQSLSRCLLLLSPYLSTKASHRVSFDIINVSIPNICF
jgi:hypothetical protein